MPVYCTGTFPLRQNLSNPPYGERGVGASVARAARWGRIENYMAQVNDSLCLLVQVESKTALDNLDEILDACYAGSGRSILVDVPIDADQVIGLNPRLYNLTTDTYL